MTAYTNLAGIPLSLAVFLATDTYDYDEDPHTISATALIRPLRQIILASRVPPTEAKADIADLINARMGTAIHDGIERAWKEQENRARALKALGYPRGVVDRIRINPADDELSDDIIPLYLEQRLYRQFGEFRISGKPDFIGEGRVEDFKSTSVYTWLNNTNDEKHQLQGSLYRWLDPKKITRNEMAVQYIFTDWSAANARRDPKYPQQRAMERILPLLSLHETERFIGTKLALITKYQNAPEAEIPLCTDADLWRKEPVFKYYKNPAKTDRSTKNFDTFHDAELRRIQDGGVGIVKEVPGGVTACKYCPAFSVCTQKDQLIAVGDLDI